MPTLNNSTSLRALRQAMAEALIDVERRYKVKISFGNIRYQRDGSSASFKGEMIGTHEDAPIKEASPYAVEWHKKAQQHGFDLKLIGTKFTSGSDVYEIVGLKPRCSTQKLVARNLRTLKLHRMSCVVAGGYEIARKRYTY